MAGLVNNLNTLEPSPRQVDDAEAEAQEAARREVEEDDGGRDGGEAEAGRGEDGADHGGQPPAQAVGHPAGDGTWHTAVTHPALVLQTINRGIYTITEKAPTRAFSWLKAPTSAFTFKTLLRHYAKRALTPR